MNNHPSLVKMNSEKYPTTDSSPQPDHATGQKTNKNSSNRAGKSISLNRDFKGATPELEGFVFNVQSEQKKKGEYNEVIDKLRAYSAKQFPESMSLLVSIFDDDQNPTIPRPEINRDYGPHHDEVDRLAFVEDVKEWKKKVRKYEEATGGLFDIVWGQCSQAMKVRLEGNENFSTAKEECDLLYLIRNIKTIYHQFDHRISHFIAIIG